MHVGLITYQAGHRKTMELALRALTDGHSVTLFAFPFVQRPPKPEARYQDRPSQIIRFDPRTMMRFGRLWYCAMPGWQDEHAHLLGDCDVYLHCTAKIIPAAWIEGRTILNCHPGLLPENRGVDAFKWSIVNGWPIGVTLHIIDEVIDRGIILHRRHVPIFQSDNLRSVCNRMYETEIDVMAQFASHIGRIKTGQHVGDEHPISHKRIPKELDDRLEQIFLERRDALMRAA